MEKMTDDLRFDQRAYPLIYWVKKIYPDRWASRTLFFLLHKLHHALFFTDLALG